MLSTVLVLLLDAQRPLGTFRVGWNLGETPQGMQALPLCPHEPCHNFSFDVAATFSNTNK